MISSKRLKLTRRESLKTIASLLGLGAMSQILGCEGVASFENDPTNGYWQLRVEQLETDYPIAHTADEPGTTQAGADLSEKVDSHLPTLKVGADGQLSIDVGKTDRQHEMVDGHFISVIYLKNQNGDVVFLRELTPRSSISTKIPIPKNTTEIIPYAVCNLHERWKGKSLIAQ
jgi:desulfoferrodoxin (superoxide reductase-like protein)